MKQAGNLVRLLDMDSEFIIDLKYASKNNFTGQQIYSSNQCFIDKNTALLLIEAKNKAKKKDYKMKIWDAYRPISAQKKFWDLVQDNDFVAYPPDMNTIKEFKNSHMNGQCVDVTLTDNNGIDLIMPSDFDDFTEKARLDCKKTVGAARENAEFLKEIMESSGFTSYEAEWWHFYDRTTTPVKYSDMQL